jgi:hypothetical protein
MGSAMPAKQQINGNAAQAPGARGHADVWLKTSSEQVGLATHLAMKGLEYRGYQ